jgi:hypothetical protein
MEAPHPPPGVSGISLSSAASPSLLEHDQESKSTGWDATADGGVAMVAKDASWPWLVVGLPLKTGVTCSAGVCGKALINGAGLVTLACALLWLPSSPAVSDLAAAGLDPPAATTAAAVAATSAAVSRLPALIAGELRSASVRGDLGSSLAGLDWGTIVLLREGETGAASASKPVPLGDRGSGLVTLELLCP